MRPYERHGTSSGTSKHHVALRSVRQSPYLLRQQVGGSGKALHGPYVGSHVTPCRQLVMAALSRKHRPGVPVSPPLVRLAVFALPVTIMVVPPPARTAGHVHLEYRIHHLQRILDQGIVRLADAVADQLKETGIHNVLARKPVGCA